MSQRTTGLSLGSGTGVSPAIHSWKEWGEKDSKFRPEGLIRYHRMRGVNQGDPQMWILEVTQRGTNQVNQKSKKKLDEAKGAPDTCEGLKRGSVNEIETVWALSSEPEDPILFNNIP